MDITRIILHLLDYQYSCFTPQEINCGQCFDFANEITDYNDNVLVVWGDELSSELWSDDVQELEDWFIHYTYRHCFMIYKNKYYDSECPQGCDYPDKLPFYQRQIKMILCKYAI